MYYRPDRRAPQRRVVLCVRRAELRIPYGYQIRVRYTVRRVTIGRRDCATTWSNKYEINYAEPPVPVKFNSDSTLWLYNFYLFFFIFFIDPRPSFFFCGRAAAGLFIIYIIHTAPRRRESDTTTSSTRVIILSYIHSVHAAYTTRRMKTSAAITSTRVIT